MVENPYEETIQSDNFIRRLFLNTVDELDLIWHQDKKNRTIEVISSDKWYFQLDNQLPFELIPGNIIEVPALIYHRVIKGKGDLELLIQEN